MEQIRQHPHRQIARSDGVRLADQTSKPEIIVRPDVEIEFYCLWLIENPPAFYASRTPHIDQKKRFPRLFV